MKIAVCVHLYHLDMWDEIESYLKNIEHKYDLYVNFSYETDGKLVKDFDWQEYVNLYSDLIKSGKNNYNLAYQHFTKYGISENRLYKKSQVEVKHKILNFKKDTKILLSPNVGVDIGAFLNTYKHVDDDTDLILKIHTKKGLGSKEVPSLDLIRRGDDFANAHGKQWFNSMMDGVLGGKEKINKIIETFYNNPKTGMVGFRKYNNFGKNMLEMEKIFPILNITQHPNESFFIGGTIFWMRNEILKKYLPKNKIDTILNKLPYGYVREPSPNHALERIFGSIVYLENKEINIIK
jgi:lipopolysaccharide biosynthesis protein